MWHGGAGGVMIGCQMPEQPKEPPFPCPRNWIAKLNQAAKLDCQEHKRNTRGVSVGGRGGDRRASVSPTSSSRVVTHHHHHHNQPAAEADQRLWAAESWANWPSAVATGGGGPAPGWAAEVLVVGGRRTSSSAAGGGGPPRGRRGSGSWAGSWAAHLLRSCGPFNTGARGISRRTSSTGIAQLSGAYPWRRASDGTEEEDGYRESFVTVLKPQVFFCKTTITLRARQGLLNGGSSSKFQILHE